MNLLKPLTAVWVCGVAACAALPAPVGVLAQNEVRWFRAERLNAEDGSVAQTSLLSVQGLANGQSRWLLADAFGAPQARLTAGAQGWQADGFAPPNRAAKQLFTALAPLIQQGTPLPPTLRTPAALWRLTLIESP
ncbi:hypothetical protein [Conchiformibius steedae]|uniref:Uncharacterized protein n=1 Tax=Conchiformibius steedae TaxID=153493 RepID=A0A3P2A874_9NEIS|nr:hypothetical protein [Conchiformibius steedae]RRD89823.1 hypothetical protein EII21_07225 [Conchiformibius steedae]